jgi:23S rRNA pseudouridine2605 synthase
MMFHAHTGAVCISFLFFAITRFGEGLAVIDRSPKQNRLAEKSIVILYHKPPNCVTSHVSDDSRKTVYDDILGMKGFLPSSEAAETRLHPCRDLSFEEVTGIRSKLHAIGRLDADTSGLLLLTNDGGLLHHVTNPTARQHKNSEERTITKTYRAVIMGFHTEESLEPIRNGVDLGAKYGGRTKPVHELQILEHPNHKSTVVSITISEGKNRQIRRMFHAIGSGVMKLQRIKIGEALTLEGVSEGQWRILTNEEVQRSLNWEPRDVYVLQQAVYDKKDHSKRQSGRRTGHSGRRQKKR